MPKTRKQQTIHYAKNSIEQYKRLHTAVWSDVLAQIKRSNIHTYSVYLREPENLLFGYLKYHGEDFAADMALMSEDDRTREWWALTAPCPSPLASRVAGEQWSPMQEVFHTN